MTEAADFESLLRRALTPIEPPTDLADRVESTLERMTDAAVDELEAFRDPRNWGRLVISGGIVAAGAGAGTALILLRARKKANRNVVQRALRR